MPKKTTHLDSHPVGPLTTISGNSLDSTAEEEEPSFFADQNEWLAQIGIPLPDHNILADISDLGALLQKFGGYIAFLEGQLGVLAGRGSGLKTAYNTAMAIRIAQSELSGSEKSKESAMLAEHEDLRKTKRLLLRNEVIYETAKGMSSGYQKAWETVSRILTLRNAEMELMPRRTP